MEELSGNHFLSFGVRKAVLNDLSPAATFIAYNYNTPVDVHAFEREAKRILAEVEEECGWMYETLHTDGKTKGKINYTVWSDVYICPECAGEVVFWEVAVDKEAGKVRDCFPCPHCHINLTKRKMNRAWLTKYDSALKESIKQIKQIPVLINYTVARKRYEKNLDKFDLELLEKIDRIESSNIYPINEIIAGKEIGRLKLINIKNINQILPLRTNIILATFNNKISNSRMKLVITSSLLNLSWMYRWRANGKGGTTSGTYYICATPQENNSINQLKTKLKDIIKGAQDADNLLSNSSSSKTNITKNSIDYVFIDPPFGANLMYSELSFLWESWLKIWTNNEEEAIINNVQNKDIIKYRQLMTLCFKEMYRVLKPRGWMTVEFSNTKASVWNSIQTALKEVGFILANVSALDKKQGSFKAVTTPTAVKQDLIISVYKPSTSFDNNFKQNQNTKIAIWNFIDEHLSHLQKFNSKTIVERTPRILYDRLISYYLTNNLPNPIDSIDFQLELKERYEERNGMYFNADEASYYDIQKSKHTNFEYEEDPILIVYNEQVGIKWLAQKLKEKKLVYSDIQPDWMKAISVNEGDVLPELKTLLEENFLQDEDGHWFLPDLENKAHLDLKRKKRLLKTWETYVGEVNKPKPKKLKETSLEALRYGFESCYHQKDFKTIVKVAEKIPQNLLMEDEVLLQFYDIAVMKV